MPEEPTIIIPELVDPDVSGSGEYTAREAIDYLDRRAAIIQEQRNVLRRMVRLYEEAVASDAARGDEDPAITQKIVEGRTLHYGRLRNEFLEAYKRQPPPPHVVRDASLLDLLEHFDSYDVDRNGSLSLAESKLSPEVYKRLSPEGELTPEKIRTGISVDSRPAVKGQR